jgi:hypothetical protein
MGGNQDNPLESPKTMPRTESPNMEDVKFAVPAPLLAQMMDMAAADGWKPAELHRVFWESGFAAYAERANKRLVNEQLREKRSAKD